MAGDWIKMRVDLQDDPSVVSLCNILEMDEFAVVGRLHKLWGWADKHTVDGFTNGVGAKWIDRYLNKTGFADAMVLVGWLKIDGDTLSFPGFDIHNGKSAKARCDSALRTRMSRERHAGVTNKGDKRVTIPRPFVRAVMQRDNYTCVYCGTESSPNTEAGRNCLLSVDHILPHSRSDGRQAIEDLATCCKLCNNEKNDRTPEEWGILPQFLQDGVSYENGMLVTEKRYSGVTEPLPEKRREEKSNKRVSRKTERLSIRFSDWYAKYPRKVARAAAESAYDKAVLKICADESCDIPAAEEMLMNWTEERLAGLNKMELAYVPHPASWLNGERYRDQIDFGPVQKKCRPLTREEIENYVPTEF